LAAYMSSRLLSTKSLWRCQTSETASFSEARKNHWRSLVVQFPTKPKCLLFHPRGRPSQVYFTCKSSNFFFQSGHKIPPYMPKGDKNVPRIQRDCTLGRKGRRILSAFPLYANARIDPHIGKQARS
jgi:hypothetical protein